MAVEVADITKFDGVLLQRLEIEAVCERGRAHRHARIRAPVGHPARGVEMTPRHGAFDALPKAPCCKGTPERPLGAGAGITARDDCPACSNGFKIHGAPCTMGEPHLPAHHHGRGHRPPVGRKRVRGPVNQGDVEPARVEGLDRAPRRRLDRNHPARPLGGQHARRQTESRVASGRRNAAEIGVREGLEASLGHGPVGALPSRRSRPEVVEGGKTQLVSHPYRGRRPGTGCPEDGGASGGRRAEQGLHRFAERRRHGQRRGHARGVAPRLERPDRLAGQSRGTREVGLRHPEGDAGPAHALRHASMLANRLLTSRSLRTLVIAVTVAAAACGRAGSDTGTVMVFAASSLVEPVRELAAAFEDRHPDTAVRVNFAASSDLAVQLAEGAPADVFASADRVQMEVAAAAGRVPDATPLATNRLVVVVHADNPAEIEGARALGGPGIALVLAGEAVPAGRYARAALEALGIGPAAEANVVSNEDDVKSVVTKVALGEADAGVVYATDVTETVRGEVMAFEFPPAAQVTAHYEIAPVLGAPNPDAARAFVALALSPDGREVFERHGFGVP